VIDGETPPLVEVYSSGTAARAEELALVLVAVGVSCRINAAPGGYALLVPAADAARAQEQIAAYARENQKPLERHRATWRLGDCVTAAMAYAALLWAFYVVSRRGAFGQDWLAAGVAEAGRILGGEWWRTITAMTLHADIAHVGGNIFFGMIFGALISQALGPGLAWLAVLVAGALANALNAALHPATHSSIGASTAVFAALGILSGLMWKLRAPPWRHGLRRWAPLAGGVMLLVFLGTEGERTDVGGHALGFATGGIFGVAFARVADRLPRSTAVQWLCGAGACLLVALAWLLAL
jgi:membrane associated rhomboid family serine protease